MIIHENEEVLLTEIVKGVKLYLEYNNKQNREYLQDKIEFLLKHKSNEFIDYVNVFLSQNYDFSYFDLFLNQLLDTIEYSLDNNKQHLVIAIPLILIGYQSITNIDFIRRNDYFNNRLDKLSLDIEYILSKKIKTQYVSGLRIHDSLIDLSQLFKKYKEINGLKKDMLITRDFSENSIITQNVIEEYSTEEKDGLKFIIGIIEFDPREDLNLVIKNSFKHIEQDYETIYSKFADLFIDQQISVKKTILLPPNTITNAIQIGWDCFHNEVLMSLINGVFNYNKRDDIHSHIIYVEAENIIYILFFDKSNSEVPFYRIEASHGVSDFEKELESIFDIFKKIDIKYKITRA